MNNWMTHIMKDIAAITNINEVREDMVKIAEKIEAGLVQDLKFMVDHNIDVDRRLLAVARTQIELGFMALYKAIRTSEKK